MNNAFLPALNPEEVFAENYDDKSESAQGIMWPLENPLHAGNTHAVSPVPITENGIPIFECVQCPNLQNPCHNCVA